MKRPAWRRPHGRLPSARHLAGFTLIELMVALILGLIVIASATAVYLSDQQSYRTNTALSEVQENGRIAFELLARDLRQAGLTGCGNSGRVADVLNTGPAAGGTAWWANWGNALIGYDGNTADPAVTTATAPNPPSTNGERVGGTDSLEIVGADGSGFSVASHQPTSATIKITEPTTNLQSGDIVVVCDPDHAAITQITNYNSSNVTVVHNTGTGSPGNCSKGLGFPTQCTTNGNLYMFPPNSQIAKLTAADWYIGYNPLGGRSLYRISLVNNAGVPTPTAQEMVRNVSDMQLTYLVKNATGFVPAGSVGAANWAAVEAVQATLTLQSADQRAGTNAQPLTRQVTTTITLRNRVD